MNFARAVRSVTAGLATAFVLLLVLDVVPPALLATHVFTALVGAAVVLCGARIAAKSRWLRAKPGRLTAPGNAAACLALFVGTVAAGSYLRAPFWLPAGLAAKTAGDRRVYVVSHGWHTSLMFATAAVEAADFPLIDAYRTAPWFEAGWGDADFFQADEVTLGVTFDALFVPGPSVLHVASLAAGPLAAFPDAPVVELALSNAQFRAVVRHVAASFALGADGRPVMTAKGDYGEGSRFVRANGSYYFPNTCNVWTAKGLKAAGLPVVPELAVTARNLLFQAARLGKTLR